MSLLSDAKQLTFGVRNRASLIPNAALGWRRREEVSMVDLRDTSNPESRIDTLGWVFVAVFVVITALAAMVAYNANDLTVTNTVSHVAAR